MAFPPGTDIEQAILDELQARGGQAQRGGPFTQAVAKRLMARFPNFTVADLQIKDPKTRANSFQHRLDSARRRMVAYQPPLLAPSAPRGVWQLPVLVPPQPSKVSAPALQPPPDEPDKLVDEIKSLVEKPVDLAKKGEQKPPLPSHNELVQKVKEMGEMLGKIAETNWGPKFKHDCVWKDNPYANPKAVIEVCDKGNLYKDIVSLPWAVSNWGAKGILVVCEESDFHATQRKLLPGSQVYPLKAADMLKLHSLVQAGYIQAIRAIFSI